MASDPYWDWLAIPPGSRPPDFYQLLGLSRFEIDPERIRTASIDRSAAVRKFCLGPRSNEASQVLAELAAAFACLADPDHKAAYDRALEAERTGGSKDLLLADQSRPPVQHSTGAAAPVQESESSPTACDKSGAIGPASHKAAAASLRMRSRNVHRARKRAANVRTALFLALPILLGAIVIVAALSKKNASEEPPQPTPVADRSSPDSFDNDRVAAPSVGEK